MVGTSSLTVDFTVAGGGSSPFQLNARIYDLAPDGTQTMVDRGTRSFTQAAGPLTFDVHGNGWRFAKDHKIRIELAQDDDPYIKSSTVPSSAVITGISLAVPIREASDTIAGGAAPDPPGEAGAASGGFGSPGSGAAADRTPPRLRLRSLGRRSLRGRVLSVRASADEACALLGISRLSLLRVRSRATFRSALGRGKLTRAGTTTMRMKLSRRAAAAVRLSLRARRRVSTRVTVAATDAAGNTARRRLRLRIKR